MKLFIVLLAALVFVPVGFGGATLAQSPEAPESQPESGLASASLDLVGTIEGIESFKGTELDDTLHNLNTGIIAFEYGSVRTDVFNGIVGELKKFRSALDQRLKSQRQAEGYLREGAIPRLVDDEVRIEVKINALNPERDPELVTEYREALELAKALTLRARNAADYVQAFGDSLVRRIENADLLIELCTFWRDTVLQNRDERTFISEKIKKLRSFLFSQQASTAAKAK